MRALTNDYRDVQVVNLDPWSGQPGPYLVMQTGYAPGDPEFRESTFILRPDGIWVDLNVYLGEGALDGLKATLFGTLAEVVGLLDDLPTEPQVANLPVDLAGLKRFLDANPQGTALQQLRIWVQRYEASLNDERRSG